MAYLSIREGRLLPTGNRGKKITHKMLSFVDEYFGAGEFNANKSIRLSAYKTDTMGDGAITAFAAELMTHPLVVAEIERRQAFKTAKSEVKAEYLIAKLTQIIDRTEEDNPNAALRAIELLGKSIALWKERQEISGPDGEAIKHEQHIKESVAEFTSRIASLAERHGKDGPTVVPFTGRTSGT